MPAFNQLAIYYLEQAKAKAGRKSGRKAGLVVSGAAGKNVDQQMLDLAALVTAQGITKNPKYASIYNTAGLIQVEQRNYNGAVKSFKKARELDPKFFEADMNYAAVNLSFRGFKEAEAGVSRRAQAEAEGIRGASRPRPRAARCDRRLELRQERRSGARPSSTSARSSTAIVRRPTTTRRF